MVKAGSYEGYTAVVASKGRRIHLECAGPALGSHALCGVETDSVVIVKGPDAIKEWQVCRKCLAVLRKAAA